MAAFYNDLEQGAERNGQIMQSTPVYWYKVYRTKNKPQINRILRSGKGENNINPLSHPPPVHKSSDASKQPAPHPHHN